MRIAIIGAGIAGLSAAYQLALSGADFVLFEAADRLGGIIETVRQQGFTIDCGPDAWISEKPWARELAIELGLSGELLPSNDATRKTYIAAAGSLTAIPDGMRMMIPSDLATLGHSSLFSDAAKLAYRAEPARAAELKATALTDDSADESVAAFVERHFGEEVATTIAAPLLAGVFGGDIHRLSVRSVMPAFVAMEREHGSLITALQRANSHSAPAAIFTTLSSGLETLVDRIAARLPAASVRCNTPVTGLTRAVDCWRIDGQFLDADTDPGFDAVILATPAKVTVRLLAPLDFAAAALLPRNASSAVVVALGLDSAASGSLNIPPGFGFLVAQRDAHGGQDQARSSALLAATFTHQKFAHRAPGGSALLRAFFGGRSAAALADQDDASLTALALAELSRYLGPLPPPALAVVRRWPDSLPQYEVGHRNRIAEFEARLQALSALKCIGNAFHGVGLPDLIRGGRAAARELLAR